MIRPPFTPDRSVGETDFRWRGGDVSRIEALTDAVFAFALTLLVVSLEVPSNYAEMRAAFVQLPVFAVCFGILYWFWLVHYYFHRRYGLEDPITLALNALFVFVVLFYVFPLKFLFRAMWTATLLGKPYALDAAGEPVPDGRGGFHMSIQDMADRSELMVLYGLGFAGVFLILGLKTWNAWRLREVLQLDERERLITKMSIRGHAMMAAVGLVSVALVWSDRKLAPFAGLVYFLIGPIMFLHGFTAGRAVEKLRPN